MLIGLYTTIVWIPGQEHSPTTNSVKTLEQWQIGRMPEKDYSDTQWGKVIVKVYKWTVGVGDAVFMFFDGLSGGEERERRKEKVATDGSGDDERELDDMDRERERGRSGAPEAPLRQVDDGGVRLFVNGSVRHTSSI